MGFNWGTEVLRRGFHQDIWVASVENKLRTLKENVVITDCRFINEINAIRESGGIVVRTHRGSDPEWLSLAAQYNHAENANLRELYKNQLENQFKIHASEYSSVGLTYDFYLDNNRTIDDLHNQIELIVNH